MSPRAALIVAGIALVVGVVGLVIGISAKDGNRSNDELSNSIRTELKEELGSTAAGLKSEQQAQAVEQAGSQKNVGDQLKGINTQIKKLQADVGALSTGSSRQSAQIQGLTNSVDKLERRVGNLESSQ